MLPLVITVRSADGQTRRYAFAESPVSIGRSPFAELQLSEPFVSRWEGTVRFDEREVTYFILGSTNTTYVDGRPVTEREQDLPIGVNSVLAIGELELRFTREPVPEADIRRKGKRRPVEAQAQVAAKTMYLDAAQIRAISAAHAGQSGAPSSKPPAPPQSAAAPSAPELGMSALTVIDPPAGSEPEPEPAFEPPPSAATVLGGGAAAPSADAQIADAYRAYRDATSKLVRTLTEALTAAPESQRAALGEQLQRRYPRVVGEPDFRALLKKMGLPISRSEVPEVRDWLLEVGKDVLPPRLQLDTGLTLERIFRLLEILTQSLAEINAAQDSVRSRWLGRAPRRSVLRSENGRAVLAYLLNPKADWSERVAELEQTIREAVQHELALFKATLEAARKLVESLAPEALEQAADQEPASSDAGDSWWQRLRGEGGREARLWRQLVATHESLLDGSRYQRFFLGRMFAHSYLVAMGQSETPD